MFPSLFVGRDNHIPVFEQDHPSILPCWVFHPLYPSSCTIHAMKRWLLGFWSGVPVYSMVHILPLLLFRYKTLLKRCINHLLSSSPLFFVDISRSIILSVQSTANDAKDCNRDLLLDQLHHIVPSHLLVRLLPRAQPSGRRQQTEHRTCWFG